MRPSPQVADLAALRSVGLRPGRLAVASKVVVLPDVVDVTGLTAPGPYRRRRRLDVELGVRRQLLADLSDRTRAAGATGLIAVECTETPVVLRETKQANGDCVELALSALPVTFDGVAGRDLWFRTALGAADVATLIRGGWTPVDVAVAGVTRVRARTHAPQDAMVATGRRNAELPGATHMVQTARRAVVEQFSKTARSMGADGVFVHGPFDVRWSSTRHLVQVSAWATIVARVGARGKSAHLELTVRQAIDLTHGSTGAGQLITRAVDPRP